MWQTKANKIPDKVVISNGTEVYDPADIKGSYALKDVSSLYSIPLEDILAAFNLSKDKSDIKCKDVEKEYGGADGENIEIGLPSIRMFVAFYKQLPYEVSSEILPESAVEVLKQKDTLTEEQLKYLEVHTYHAKK
jgi:hydroxymethylpyrimidine pyrophosphatase-like HAD family hydrolase